VSRGICPVSHTDEPSLTTVNVRMFNEFGVLREKHFTIVCERLNSTYRARLYAEEQIRVIMIGVGCDHLAALLDLHSEVGIWAYTRKNEANWRAKASECLG
jgi:hypothetical protein